MKRRIGLTVVLGALVLVQSSDVAAQSTSLPLGAPVDSVLQAGQSHSFTLPLAANKFIYGEVVQHTVDVVVKLFGPDQELRDSFDTPARGPEPFYFTTSAAGTYHIEVLPYRRQTSGEYTMTWHTSAEAAQTPTARVEQLFTRFDRTDAPGVAIGVLRGGELVQARGYGLADMEHDVHLAPETVSYIGSVGKQFVTFALVLLAEQGMLSFDDEVQKHVEEFPSFEHPITIRHLILHTSGLRDYFGLLELAGLRQGELVTQQDALDVVFKQMELNFTPGDTSLYSNSNYVLLATIVERITGESFHAWMKANVFEPLGMAATQVGDDHRRIIHNRAWSYSMRNSGGYEMDVFPYEVYGPGGIYSSVSDMAKWLANFDAHVVGSDATFDQMYERGILNAGDTLRYAFGLGIDDYRGLRRIGHSGALAGYRAWAGRFPEQDLGIVVLCNFGQCDAGGLAMEIADIYLADQLPPTVAERASMTNNAPVEPQSQAEETDPFDPSADELAAYAGAYTSPELETTYRLYIEEDKLMARHPRSGPIVLQPEDRDMFSGSTPFFRDVAFSRNARGKIDGFRVSSGRVRNLWFRRGG